MKKVAKMVKIIEKIHRNTTRTMTPKMTGEIAQMTEQDTIETTTIDTIIIEGELITTVTVVANRLIRETNAQHEMRFAISVGSWVTG